MKNGRLWWKIAPTKGTSACLNASNACNRAMLRQGAVQQRFLGRLRSPALPLCPAEDACLQGARNPCCRRKQKRRALAERVLGCRKCRESTRGPRASRITIGPAACGATTGADFAAGPAGFQQNPERMAVACLSKKLFDRLKRPRRARLFCLRIHAKRYPEMYVRNSYDWIFFYVLQGQEPLVAFREIWQSLLGMVLESHPQTQI